ncbi:MAG: aminotransferase class III [Candidatus Pacebacteria bacterium RIFOXYA1_FULL_38_18]|nr:MAG: aminotransferase class III [Candidatus Pacebacteria bacterium RIFOXYA1_FULL_38_18]OGJ39462.1 MAG: aminotransferase class III [Candidatus Pacebacteria bacterium RIFOXYC1_FULL_39_21]
MSNYKANKSVALWKQAKKLIPGGSQLVSKRSEMFLPDQWPAYYKSAKGIEVIDLDNNHYLDFSLMGVGSCVLGYADSDVNKAVMSSVKKGSMSTLNPPEEVELAEKLLELHPWAKMVRYARTGGEAMAIAVRIARAHSKRDKIAFCGYHGWHDWYLASNLANDKNLDGHLLPGLEPKGVPRSAKGLSKPFEYNKIEQLKKIVKKNNIGVIVVETIRHQEPKNNFLSKIREIADEINAVLIFDEISCGFRLTLGGAHLLYGVNPDIAVFAKAMSNGYPMATIIGRKKVMNAAQSTFISSTYWTDRIGPTAALATIKKLDEKNVSNHLNLIGKEIEKGWLKLAKRYDLKVKIIGPYSLITLDWEYKNANDIRTLFTQEMLYRGFLTSSTVYVSYAHKIKHVKTYLEAVDRVFAIIKQAVSKNQVKKKLNGPSAHKGFKRLT